MEVKERIYENTKALSKIKRIPMAEIEEKIDVSTGYLSKASKKLSIEKVMRLANVLDVSIDELINGDFWEIYKKELAESELKEAVERAKRAMRGADVLEIVNRILEDTGVHC